MVPCDPCSLLRRCGLCSPKGVSGRKSVAEMYLATAFLLLRFVVLFCAKKKKKEGKRQERGAHPVNFLNLDARSDARNPSAREHPAHDSLDANRGAQLRCGESGRRLLLAMTAELSSALPLESTWVWWRCVWEGCPDGMRGPPARCAVRQGSLLPDRRHGAP